MNVALIFAGGTGQRMNTKTRPKQFLELHGKPIIVHTLEQFDGHCLVDGIVVVCLNDWIPFLVKSIEKFGVSKVAAVVPGGNTGQESIRNGLEKISELYPDDSIVLVHDGVRPLIDGDTIESCILCANENGNAVTVAPAIETIVEVDGEEVVDIIDRSACRMARAPQCFVLRELREAHDRSSAQGLRDFIDSASMMKHFGYELHVVEGKSDNIKITTPADFFLFRAIVDARENSQIFGF